jgi:hypothetical protein
MMQGMSPLAASLALLLMLSAGMFKRQIRWKPPKPRRVRVRARRFR